MEACGKALLEGETEVPARTTGSVVPLLPPLKRRL
jgi:hypothetical protein